MIKLSTKQTSELLKFIKDPKDRKIVKKFLRELQKNNLGTNESGQVKLRKSRLANEILIVLSRVGVELLKHEAYGKFLRLFD